MYFEDPEDYVSRVPYFKGISWILILMCFVFNTYLTQI
jgi:hypothetical protein